MARPKLPENELKETVGIKLSPEVIEILKARAKAEERKPSAVGRDLLLLGLAATESSADSIEEALQNAQFFHAKGLSENDLKIIRPILEALDRQIEELAKE